VFIPVFPGTNCEYDTERAFRRAGADVETIVFRNLTASDVKESIHAFVEQIEKSQIIAIPGGFSAGDEPEGSGKFIASVFRNPRIEEAVMNLLKSRDGLMLGICNGFQALVKLGLLPYGEIKDLDLNAPTLTFNKIGRHVAKMADVRVASTRSPWMSEVNVGDLFKTAFSHGEGRFYASEEIIAELAKNGQIATQYVDLSGNASYDGQFNINGSVHAIEGVFSPDGRVFGKMGHVERVGKNLYKNVYGNTDFDIFTAGVKYFK
jgi:phosphoribosylformylglycinamidine synthase